MANPHPQAQQLPVQPQPLITSGVHLDANQMNPAWSNYNGHSAIIPAAGSPYSQPMSPAAGSPYGQPMSPSSHIWNGQPYYTGSNGQLVHAMQPPPPQYPPQTHQPMPPAAMLYNSVDMEKQRKAERNQEIKNRLKKDCIDGCRSAVSAAACIFCFCCTLTLTASY